MRMGKSPVFQCHIIIYDFQAAAHPGGYSTLPLQPKKLASFQSKQVDA